jgi:hypothetical protein
MVATAAIWFLWSSPAKAESGRVYSAEEIAFVAQLNHYRMSNGQQPLALSDTLSLAAERHCLDMAYHSFISHTTDTRQSDWFRSGSYPWDRMRACGYDYDTRMGENIGAGQSTADSLFDGFKASTDHNMVMLHDELGAIGISFEEVTGSECTYYWTADFGGYVDGSAHAFTFCQQDESELVYEGYWTDIANTSCSGGDIRYLDSPGSLTVRFTGNSLSWIAGKSNTCGQASVALDAEKPVTVDLYSPAALNQRCVYSTGTLEEGDHTLVIEWTGTANPDASGSLVSVDAFDVQGSLVGPKPQPLMEYLSNLVRYLRLAMLDGEPKA